jgi:hypothetical protein
MGPHTPRKPHRKANSNPSPRYSELSAKQGEVPRTQAKTPAGRWGSALVASSVFAGFAGCVPRKSPASGTAIPPQIPRSRAARRRQSRFDLWRLGRGIVMQVRAADFGRARAVGLIRVLVGAHRPGRAVDCTPGRAVDCTPGRAVDCTPGRAVDCTPGRAVDCTPGRAVDCTPGREVDCTPGREAGCTQARVQIRIEAISRRETHYWTTYNEPVNIRSSLCCCRRAFDDQQ